MSTQSHYRRLAQNCMRMAAECAADPLVATSLRTLAADYLSRAEAIERPVGQQRNNRFSPRNRKAATSKLPPSLPAHLFQFASGPFCFGTPVACFFSPKEGGPSVLARADPARAPSLPAGSFLLGLLPPCTAPSRLFSPTLGDGPRVMRRCTGILPARVNESREFRWCVADFTQLGTLINDKKGPPRWALAGQGHRARDGSSEGVALGRVS